MQSSLDQTNVEVNDAQRTDPLKTKILIAVTIVLALICIVLAYSVFSLASRVKALEEQNQAEEDIQNPFFGSLGTESEGTGSNEPQREVVPESERGYLGVSVQTVTADVAEAYNMPLGVYVFSLVDEANASNLEEGDIITGIDEVEVTTVEELIEELSFHRAGDTVTLHLFRNTNNSYEEFSVVVTLIEEPQVEDTPEDTEGQN